MWHFVIDVYSRFMVGWRVLNSCPSISRWTRWRWPSGRVGAMT
jgi:hypothetical protein